MRISIEKKSNKEGISGLLIEFGKFPMKYIYSLVLILAVASVCFVVLEVGDRKQFEELSTEYLLVGSSQSQNDFEISNPEFVEIRDHENPINGNLLTSEEFAELASRKMVVIAVNNHSKARPQFGLSDADMVVELLAEGGITRYNAYYYQNQHVEKIGPIRSARSYMLEYFLGFDDPIFVHEGQASYPPQEIAVPETNTLYHLYAWDIESMQTADSRYRDKERIVTSGYVHSLMTGFDLINSEIERLGWVINSDIQPLVFKYDALADQRGAIGEIELRFTSLATKDYTAKFKYDPGTNLYKRWVGGERDIDANTNLQISPKNVIVEFHKYRDAMDGHSRIIIDIVGEGDAYIFRDGQLIKAKWQKTARDKRTRYFDLSGKEVELNRGLTWVSIGIQNSSRRISELFVDGVKQ